jgi:hypothetical protein
VKPILSHISYEESKKSHKSECACDGSRDREGGSPDRAINS